jgi:hypothetical protein
MESTHAPREDRALDAIVDVLIGGVFADASVFVIGTQAPRVVTRWRALPWRHSQRTEVSFDSSWRSDPPVTDWLLALFDAESSPQLQLFHRDVRRGVVLLYPSSGLPIDHFENYSALLSTLGFGRDVCTERWAMRYEGSKKSPHSVRVHLNPAYSPSVFPSIQPYNLSRPGLVGELERAVITSKRSSLPLAAAPMRLPVYVLTASTQRRTTLESALRRHAAWLGQITWMPAVKMNDICGGRGFVSSSEEFTSAMSVLSGHVAAARRFLADGAEYALILEDDVSLHVDFGARLAAVAEWMSRSKRSGRSVFGTGCHAESFPPLVSIAYFPDARAEQLSKLPRLGDDELDALAPFDAPPWGTHGYVLSRDTALCIVGALFRPTMMDMRASLVSRGIPVVPMISDHVLFRITRRYIVRPPLAIDSGQASLVGSHVARIGDDAPVKDTSRASRGEFQLCLVMVAHVRGLLDLREFHNSSWAPHLSQFPVLPEVCRRIWIYLEGAGHLQKMD